MTNAVIFIILIIEEKTEKVKRKNGGNTKMKDKFGKDTEGLYEKRLFLLDMDGTLYLGDRLFPATKPFLSEIRRRGGRYMFITNKSSRGVSDYVKKLTRLGIPDVTEEDFFTSADAAALLFLEKYKDTLIYVQGTRSFVASLVSAGLTVTETPSDEVGAVLVGYDTELTAKKMEDTCRLLTEKELPYYATNPDWVCPTEFGYVPDCGSMCEGYFRATGKRPVFIGKPAPDMIEIVLEKLGVKKEDAVVVGDRLYTDIASGVAAGVDTVCVLSGEVTFDEVKESDIRPTYTLDGVEDIYR